VVTLRPYQERALSALWDYWERGEGLHPLLVLPTGAGKSLVMAEICRRALEWPGTRICVLAHRAELIAQNAAAIERQTGTAPGVYSAGLGRREVGHPVTVASIQSIYARAPSLDPFDLVLIDEAHRIPPESTTRYRRFLDETRLQNPDIRYVGLTATPYRMGTGRLDEGAGALFDATAYEISVLELIRAGYLSEVISRGGVATIDTTGVAIRGGEYVAGALERAADIPEVNRAAIAEVVELGQDRRAWLIFATGVGHAYHLALEVKRHGVSCAVVTGETPPKERADIIARFRAGEIRALVSVEVFLEGFDVPGVDLIAMMRPTQSPVLYVQAIGRGLRIAPGKDNCLLLDYAGVVLAHGPIDQVVIREKGPADPDWVPPARECPDCKRIWAATVKQCECGYVWPVAEPESKIEAEAYKGAVLSHQQELVPVHGVRLSRWEPKDGRTPTLLVTYRSGLRELREWLCPEHSGFARRRFEERCREWRVEAPPTIAGALALADRIPVPEAVYVRRQKENPKYLEVVSRVYA